MLFTFISAIFAVFDIKRVDLLYGPEDCTIPDLPYGGQYGHSIVLTSNGEILQCGGYSNDYKKTCLDYDKTQQQWKHHSSLTQERRFATGITMPKGIYLFGGSYSQTTFEYLPTNEKQWQEGGKSIPGGFHYGCGVR